eukprot:6085544-Prymnesium_polylepis.1
MGAALRLLKGVQFGQENRVRLGTGVRRHPPRAAHPRERAVCVHHLLTLFVLWTQSHLSARYRAPEPQRRVFEEYPFAQRLPV